MEVQRADFGKLSDVELKAHIFDIGMDINKLDKIRGLHQTYLNEISAEFEKRITATPGTATPEKKEITGSGNEKEAKAT